MATPTKVSTFVFMDFEATGLASVGDHPRATELGLVAVSRESLLEPFVYAPRVQDKLLLCINPGKVIHPTASTLTGLFNDNLETQGPWNDDLVTALTGFFRRLRQPVCMLAHHGFGYDYKLLAAELRRTNTQLPANILCADTLVIFRGLDAQGIVPIYISPRKQALQTPQMMIIKKQDPPPAPKKKPVQLKPDSVTKSHITNAKRKIFSDDDQVMLPSSYSTAKSLCTDRVVSQNLCQSTVNTNVPLSTLNASNTENTRRILFPELNKSSSSSASESARVSDVAQDNKMDEDDDDELEPMPDDCSIFSNDTIPEWESDFSEDEVDTCNTPSQSLFQAPIKSSPQTANVTNASMVSKRPNLNNCTKSKQHSNMLMHDQCVASTSVGCVGTTSDFDDWDDAMSDNELLAEVAAMEKQLVLSDQSTDLNHKQSSTSSLVSKRSLSNSNPEAKLGAVDKFSPLNKSVPVTSTDSLPGCAIHKTPEKNIVNNTGDTYSLTDSNMSKPKRYNSSNNNSITCTSTKSGFPLSSAAVQTSASTSAGVGRFLPTACTSNSPNSNTSQSSSCVRQSYKLSEIYKRIFGALPEVSHTAEDDCITLLAVSKCYGADFCNIVDRTAVLFSGVQPFE